MTELTDELTTMTTKRSGRNIDAASLDLEAIKARSEAATEGPWEWDNPTVGQHWSRPEPWATVVDDEVNCGGYCYGGSSSPIKSDADGQFIAHAREDIPALVAEVERLRAQPTITDEMFTRGALAMHRITCDTHWHECSHAGPAGCMAIARQVLEAAIGDER